MGKSHKGGTDNLEVDEDPFYLSINRLGSNGVSPVPDLAMNTLGLLDHTVRGLSDLFVAGISSAAQVHDGLGQCTGDIKFVDLL